MAGHFALPLPRKVPTTPQRSHIMSAIHSKGNKSTEARLIQIMRRHHITGWRRNWPLFGKPDFVFPEYKLVVFVDGCFWHGCSRCYKEPRKNVEFWREKIRRNILRDRRTMRILKMKGWHVMRFWEHALNRDITVANRIIKAIG